MKDNYDWQMLPSGAFCAVVPSTDYSLHTHSQLGHLSTLDRRVETAQDCEAARELLERVIHRD